MAPVPEGVMVTVSGKMYPIAGTCNFVVGRFLYLRISFFLPLTLGGGLLSGGEAESHRLPDLFVPGPTVGVVLVADEDGVVRLGEARDETRN